MVPWATSITNQVPFDSAAPGAGPWELTDCFLVCTGRWERVGVLLFTPCTMDPSIRVSPGVLDTVPSSVTVRSSPISLTAQLYRRGLV